MIFQRTLQGLAVLVAAWALVMTALIVAAVWTGHEPPAYQCLRPDDTVRIAGEEVRVDELARRYRPVMHLRRSTPSPPLVKVWYQAVPAEETVDLVYSFHWHDEENPDDAVHLLYTVIRAAYFGYPPVDIEYFQVNVDRRTGDVRRLRFETAAGDGCDGDFYEIVPRHIVAIVDTTPDGGYLETRQDRDGRTLAEARPTNPRFTAPRRALAGVETWNHLSCLLGAEAEDFRPVDGDVPLVHLSAEDYGRLKFARKSQGDHRTEASVTRLVVTFLAVFVAMVLPLLLRGRFRPEVL